MLMVVSLFGAMAIGAAFGGFGSVKTEDADDDMNASGSEDLSDTSLDANENAQCVFRHQSR
jgi:hypothetical protein